MLIKVLYKNFYGKDAFEPLSDEAKALCQIAKADNLMLWQLDICEASGWTVDIQSPHFTLKDLRKK